MSKSIANQVPETTMGNIDANKNRRGRQLNKWRHIGSQCVVLCCRQRRFTVSAAFQTVCPT